jgi:hypothetical protein
MSFSSVVAQSRLPCPIALYYTSIVVLGIVASLDVVDTVVLAQETFALMAAVVAHGLQTIVRFSGRDHCRKWLSKSEAQDSR